MEKTKKKRMIAIITGSRGEYGYIRPIIREIEKHDDLDYGVIATNMHVLDSFGSSITELEKDNIKIFSRINNTFDGYNHVSMAKSLAVFQLQLPEILEQMGADMILLAGDRGEQLVGAIVGAHMYIPTAHIQAGELSGNIDGSTRHAITKFAHLHFASNDDAAERVRKVGEEDHRVHMVGAPQLDDFVGGKITSAEKIYKQFALDADKPVMLFVFHPVTEEVHKIESHMDEVMKAVSTFDGQVVIISSNSDAGGNIVRRKILEYRKPNMKMYKNVKREDYAGLMRVADVMVGNSSSGILEAPSFHLPVVNIGNRQLGRLQGDNVINTDYVEQEIVDAIDTAMSPNFVKKVQQCTNPYGDGKSATRIVDVLKQAKLDEGLLIKKLTY